ncbi:hypothetical protein D3C80_1408410 [compost metagenome]
MMPIRMAATSFSPWKMPRSGNWFEIGLWRSIASSVSNRENSDSRAKPMIHTWAAVTITACV